MQDRHFLLSITYALVFHACTFYALATPSESWTCSGPSSMQTTTLRLTSWKLSSIFRKASLDTHLTNYNGRLTSACIFHCVSNWETSSIEGSIPTQSARSLKKGSRSPTSDCAPPANCHKTTRTKSEHECTSSTKFTMRLWTLNTAQSLRKFHDSEWTSNQATHTRGPNLSQTSARYTKSGSIPDNPQKKGQKHLLRNTCQTKVAIQICWIGNTRK